METSTPNNTTWQRWLLISLQAVLLLSWLPFEFFRRQSFQRIHHHTSAEDFCGPLFLGTTLALIILSLFCLRSHTRIALTGIIVGLAALAYCILLPGHF